MSESGILLFTNTIIESIFNSIFTDAKVKNIIFFFYVIPANTRVGRDFG
jgi:hypothetical protein